MPVVRHAQTRADITMVAQWTYSAKPPNLFRPLYWPLHPEAQGISCRASVFWRVETAPIARQRLMRLAIPTKAKSPVAPL